MSRYKYGHQDDAVYAKDGVDYPTPEQTLDFLQSLREEAHATFLSAGFSKRPAQYFVHLISLGKMQCPPYTQTQWKVMERFVRQRGGMQQDFGKTE
jgi:hypothetical protein